MNLPLPEDFSIDRYGLHVRFISEDDAEFLVALRTDPKLGKYINPTDSSIDKQIEWTHNYKERQNWGEDFYFMFEKPKGTPWGVCRIYDINTDSFTIGSWVFSPNAPVGTSILADIITREIAFELFPGKQLLFDVKKENLNVNRYQATYKCEKISEDDESFFYTLSKDNFEKYKKIHLRMFAPKGK